MIKVTSPLLYALMLIILCMCTACSPPEPVASSKPLISHHHTGCGIAQKGTGNFVPMKIRILNQDRTYNLRIPSTYDPNRPYPLIFRWHGSGGDGLSGGLGIEDIAKNDAIIVSADGLNNYWRTAPDSIDLPFFDSMLETISNQYCIDSARIFSYGFSVGGGFSNLLACERGDVLRASAAIAGGIAGGNCKGKVATWLLHDTDDDAVAIAKGKAMRDRALAINGCSTNTADERNGCVRYQGCDAAPVVWCESKGFGHNIRGDYAPAQVWKFFQSFQ
jgi:poly(3-hydroxybutyrate) depolymerase